MKRQRKSVWPARIEAGWRPQRGSGRPRGMSQVDWFLLTPNKRNPFCRWPVNGWGGGRDRYRPRKTRLHYHERGILIGGVVACEPQPLFWRAWVSLVDDEPVFGRRRDAKRWVEAAYSGPRRCER